MFQLSKLAKWCLVTWSSLSLLIIIMCNSAKKHGIIASTYVVLYDKIFTWCSLPFSLIISFLDLFFHNCKERKKLFSCWRVKCVRHVDLLLLELFLKFTENESKVYHGMRLLGFTFAPCVSYSSKLIICDSVRGQ